MVDFIRKFYTEAIIERVKTDEYWIKYGGNYPNYGDGKELIDAYSHKTIVAYLHKTDAFKTERKYTLLVHLNETINHNLMKNKIQNRTCNHEVQILKMNGETIYIGLSGVEDMEDLIEDLYWYLKLDIPNLKRNMIKLMDGERLLGDGSRLIITDETVLTLVISRK